MDLAPAVIDHATLGVAPWGRHGWGAAILMRDVSDDLPELGDQPIDAETHAAFLDGIAALAAPMWGIEGELGLLPHRLRWAWFGASATRRRAATRLPRRRCPRSPTEGWAAIRGSSAGRRGRRDRRAAQRHRAALGGAAARPPRRSFTATGRSATSAAPPTAASCCSTGPTRARARSCHELAWYLALNRARIPRGHTKESTIDDFRSALERHGIATAGLVGPSVVALPARCRRAVRMGEGARRRRRARLVDRRRPPRATAVVSDRSIADAYTRTGAAWDAGPGRIYDKLSEELVARLPGGTTGGACSTSEPGRELPAGPRSATGAAQRRGDRCRVRHARASTARRGHPGVVADARRLPFARGERSTPSSPPSR